MPYKVFKEDDEYCVHKMDDAGEMMGDSMGCHASMEEAQAQVDALYAEEESAKAGVTKKERDGEHPASHYLVVEDDQSPSTWHLRVMNAAGEVDHRLMGAAWAALHEGYRGQTYQGPGKGAALAKLKKLYKQEKLDMPGSPGKAAMLLSVKAVEGGRENEIELLVPYGGPYSGKDRNGDYFTKSTDFSVPGLPDLPRPVVYLHTFNDATPQAIGTAVSFRDAPEGRWYRVILDTTKAIARQCLEALAKGTLRASSQAVASFIRSIKDTIGERITHWPIVELTLVDESAGEGKAINPYAVVRPAYAKASLANVGLNLDEDGDGAEDGDPPGQSSDGGQHGKRINVIKGVLAMDEKELAKLVSDSVATALADKEKDAAAKAEAEAARKKEQDDAIAVAVKAEREKFEAELRRLPGGAPNIASYSPLWKYDNLDPADQAVMVGVLQEAQRIGRSKGGATEYALKALAVKLGEDKNRIGEVARQAMKAEMIPMKADEIMQQDLTGFGDEWVGVAYSQQIWDAIRVGTFVAAKLPSIEVPPGHESITIPLEGADPTFYKVAEVTDLPATGRPDATVTASKMATGSKSLSLAKLGGRTVWSGELEEDSLIPFVAQLRKQLEMSGAEYLESAIIDGDTAAGATTNINDIGATPAATDWFMLFNGFRKSPLVTTTANSRSGGALDAEDFLETVKLMGGAGINGLDRTKTEFIIDPNVHWVALTLPEVKTRDVFAQPTLEGGMLTAIYGYKVNVSNQMHKASAVRKTNTAGKVDRTTIANNTKGAILAVRWDQWLLGWRRRMTLELQRWPEADATQIVALMRAGLVQRDTEASAISYNITV